jgi:hypothetical protein
MPIIKASFNHNDLLSFRLTAEAARVLNEHNAAVEKMLRDRGFINPTKEPIAIAGSTHRMQFWKFCQVFGAHMAMGMPSIVEGGLIEVV